MKNIEEVLRGLLVEVVKADGSIGNPLPLDLVERIDLFLKRPLRDAEVVEEYSVGAKLDAVREAVDTLRAEIRATRRAELKAT